MIPIREYESLMASAHDHRRAAIFHESPKYWGNCGMTPEQHIERAKELEARALRGAVQS